MIIIKKCLQTFKLRMWFWKCKQKKLSIERVSQSNYGPSVFTFHSTNQRPVFSWDCYYCTTQLQSRVHVQSVRWQKTKNFFLLLFQIVWFTKCYVKGKFFNIWSSGFRLWKYQNWTRFQWSNSWWPRSNATQLQLDGSFGIIFC